MLNFEYKYFTESSIMKKITSLICSLLIICIWRACATTKPSEKSKLNVVVTNSIWADITQNIGKDKINLHSIVPKLFQEL